MDRKSNFLLMPCKVTMLLSFILFSIIVFNFWIGLSKKRTIVKKKLHFVHRELHFCSLSWKVIAVDLKNSFPIFKGQKLRKPLKPNFPNFRKQIDNARQYLFYLGWFPLKLGVIGHHYGTPLRIWHINKVEIGWYTYTHCFFPSFRQPFSFQNF